MAVIGNISPQAKFASFRRGWVDGAGVKAISRTDKSEEYKKGYQCGREAFNEHMARARKEMGLPLAKKVGV